MLEAQSSMGRASGLAAAWRSSRTCERLFDVIHDIVRRFAANAEADKSLADRVAAPARAALGARMQPAEARGLDHELAGRQEALCRSGARKAA